MLTQKMTFLSLVIPNVITEHLPEREILKSYQIIKMSSALIPKSFAVTCKSFTKGGRQCRIRSNLVDGLCAKHREIGTDETTFKCDFVILRGSRKGTECGSACNSSLKCRKHSSSCFIVYVPGELKGAGPFRKREMAEKVLKHIEGSQLMEIFTFDLPEEEKEERLQCTHVFNKGSKAGTTCTKKTSRDGGPYCPKHSSVPIDEEALKQQQETPNEGGCVFVLSKGKSKGLECRKKVVSGTDRCPKHTADNRPRPIEMQEVHEVLAEGSEGTLKHSSMQLEFRLDVENTTEEEFDDMDIEGLRLYMKEDKTFVLEGRTAEFKHANIYEAAEFVAEFICSEVQEVYYDGSVVQIKSKPMNE